VQFSRGYYSVPGNSAYRDMMHTHTHTHTLRSAGSDRKHAVASDISQPIMQSAHIYHNNACPW